MSSCLVRLTCVKSISCEVHLDVRNVYWELVHHVLQVRHNVLDLVRHLTRVLRNVGVSIAHVHCESLIMVTIG